MLRYVAILMVGFASTVQAAMVVRRQIRTILALLLLLATASSAVAVMIETVPVGNPGNAPDTRYGAAGVGSVGYVYQVGKYEVTAGQYTEFLNAVADSDTYGLYSEFMGSPLPNAGANIQRTGSSPNYSYSVAPDWANRPVNYVSFWDAARFANWLHNGQPTGPQGPGTTEDGAYHDVGDQALFGRNTGAKFVLPTSDEWHKAAYHNKAAGLAANYFDFPTGSNTWPQHTLPDPGNHANFKNAGIGDATLGYTIGPPYYRTEVGAFVNSASPYGTFDQGGNVWEWSEAIVRISNRVLLGSSAFTDQGFMHAPGGWYNVPTYETYETGFRIVSVVIPEPSTLLLTIAALAALGGRRRS